MVDVLSFPKDATMAEHEMNLQKIAEISDKDFDFNNPREKTDITRYCVRAIIQNERGEICVIKSEKYGYTQIPGGGAPEQFRITHLCFWTL